MRTSRITLTATQPSMTLRYRRTDRRPGVSSPSDTLVPVLFLPWDKLNPSESLLVCFAALGLSQVTRILADTGTLIWGNGYRRRTVKLRGHIARTRQIIDAIVGKQPRSGTTSTHLE
jgi:hypothetical protein